MKSESSLQLFLDSQVPEWKDDVIAEARFKAFTGQRVDWEARFQFWRNLIIKAAGHLQLIVIDVDMVLQQWFLREGLTPLCLHQVLMEMYRCGDLQEMDDIAKFPWSFKLLSTPLIRGFKWASQKVFGRPMMITNCVERRRLIVTSLLEERIATLNKSLADGLWSGCCVRTMASFTNLCGGLEEANVIKSHLINIKKARHIVAQGENQIEGLKICLSETHVPDVSELDLHMLHLYWTMENLEKQLNILDEKIFKLKMQAVRVFQNGDRKQAKRHVKCLKSLLARKVKCTSFHERIEELISLISEAEMTKKVSEAIKIGIHLIREHSVTLQDVQACLKEVDQTILIYNATENALASVTSSSDTEELELELTRLELDDSSMQNEKSIVTEEDTRSSLHSDLHLTNVSVTEAFEKTADKFEHMSDLA